MATSRQKRIEDAIVSVIQGLSLTGIPSANVRRMVDAANMNTDGAEMPCVIVAMTGREAMEPGAGTNASDDVVYPAAVYMLDRANQDQSAKSGADTWLYWRQLIAKAFHNKRLSGVSESFRCVVQPLEIHSREAWTNNLWLSGLTINVHCRVSRS